MEASQKALELFNHAFSIVQGIDKNGFLTREAEIKYSRAIALKNVAEIIDVIIDEPVNNLDYWEDVKSKINERAENLKNNNP